MKKPTLLRPYFHFNPSDEKSSEFATLLMADIEMSSGEVITIHAYQDVVAKSFNAQAVLSYKSIDTSKRLLQSLTVRLDHSQHRQLLINPEYRTPNPF